MLCRWAGIIRAIRYTYKKEKNMDNFQGFGLTKSLEESLTKMGYTTPTPIQAKAIPLAIQGRDILGTAQTGTGKTAAFSVPLVEALLRSPQGTALVMTPTRELAKQVMEVIQKMIGFKSPIKMAFLIGGESMGKQFGQLKMNPRIIVGTPGRINDHLNRRSLKLDQTSFLVLDETDRMLDMGFGVQIDAILKHMPQRRQTLMFSATLPDAIIRMSSKYLTNPERIAMGATNVVAANIKQDVIRIDQEKKYAELVKQLNERNGSVIIFVKTKHGTEKMAKNLSRDGFEADALHGDLKQSKRDRVMGNFRRMDFRILVATDVAARGLDVPHIEHVINYDLPQVAEDYIHRMGRTARAGAEGSALCFISPQDGRKWHAIEMLMNPDMKRSGGSGERSERPQGRNRGGPRSNDSRRRVPEGGKRRFHKADGEGRSYAPKREGGFEKRGSFGPKRDDQEKRNSFGGQKRDGQENRSSFGPKRDGQKRTEGEFRGSKAATPPRRREFSQGEARPENRSEGRSENRNGMNSSAPPRRNEFQPRENRGDSRPDNGGNKPPRRKDFKPGGAPRDENRGNASFKKKPHRKGFNPERQQAA